MSAEGGEGGRVSEQIEDDVTRAGMQAPATHFLQPKISGYRQLSDEEAALMNACKAHAAGLELLIEELTNKGADLHWVDIGETHLQQGIMALVRAVAKPTGF